VARLLSSAPLLKFHTFTLPSSAPAAAAAAAAAGNALLQANCHEHLQHDEAQVLLDMELELLA
jgi:hypothetical protein